MTLLTQLRDSFLALFARKSDVWHEGNQAYLDGKSEEANPYSQERDGDENLFADEEREWLNGFYGRSDG
jgi:hypothetical protein